MLKPYRYGVDKRQYIGQSTKYKRLFIKKMLYIAYVFKYFSLDYILKYSK